MLVMKAVVTVRSGSILRTGVFAENQRLRKIVTDKTIRNNCSSQVFTQSVNLFPQRVAI